MPVPATLVVSVGTSRSCHNRTHALQQNRSRPPSSRFSVVRRRPWEQVQAGKIHALAITSAKRYSFAPDIPTFAETLKGFEVQAWFGWIAPIGVPKIIIDKLAAELNAVGQEPDVRKRLDTFTVEFSGLSGQAFADFARKERETLAPIIEKANIKLN
jgi:tripartite-type tricarboxylate transporter receptor subunit TctC